MNLIFLIKPFCYKTKSQDKNLNILRMKRAFSFSRYLFFIIFKGLSIAKNCVRPQSAPLKTSIFEEHLWTAASVFLQHYQVAASIYRSIRWLLLEVSSKLDLIVFINLRWDQRWFQQPFKHLRLRFLLK